MAISINFPKDNGLPIGMNTLSLFGISAALSVAFYYQLALFDLPCPLCLLQRVGLILMGCGFLFNVRFGIKGAHYGIALFGCVVTGSIAARQMFLHILPGDAGYGSTFLGLHFYTWALLSSIIAVVAIAVMMMLGKDRQVAEETFTVSLWGKLAMLLFALVIAANLVSTVLECGGGQCVDNPTFYQLLGQ
ncbi:disulfide bond formation protein B [Serratia marcescens]|uniref:disulfide bond formation protein B n=1 Tax=Serratia marcescens TaxID=615 RepID=UPI0006ECFD56|nr:disulfide bond formation protein B [Serratia marcescens]ALL39849.1 disulfide bond formation protein B [Serratia marcescens]PHI52372.1 disulfide bond formation protein B [Serratia marcescens]UJA53648.1 disulfide bond formation protein B [Serratia marcescens]HEJ6984589.1 disulfide bond formation protein B [Serratia marcescens]